MVIILPAIAIAFLCLLFFVLPFEERLGYVNNMLLTCIMFVFVINENIPFVKETPILLNLCDIIFNLLISSFIDEYIFEVSFFPDSNNFIHPINEDIGVPS